MSTIIGIITAITVIGVSAIMLLILETIVKPSVAEKRESDLVMQYTINKFMKALKVISDEINDDHRDSVKALLKLTEVREPGR